MWFKHLHLFQFNEPTDWNSRFLEAKLDKETYQECPPAAELSMGWVPPIMQTTELCYETDGFVLFCLKIVKKILPASVIKEHLQDAVWQIEKTEKRRVYKKERLALKEEIHQTLLTKAFTRSQYIYACFDRNTQLLMIDVAQRQQAEVFTAFLRETLGSLKVFPVDVASPASVLTRWLSKDEVPADISIQDFCVLQNPREASGKARLQKQDLFADPIQSLLNDEHFYVTQLAIQWQEQLTCVIKDDFSLQQIRFTEDVRQMAKDVHCENEVDRFVADFALTSGTMRQFLTRLLELFTAAEHKLTAAA